MNTFTLGGDWKNKLIRLGSSFNFKIIWLNKLRNSFLSNFSEVAPMPINVTKAFWYILDNRNAVIPIIENFHYFYSQRVYFMDGCEGKKKWFHVLNNARKSLKCPTIHSRKSLENDIQFKNQKRGDCDQVVKRFFFLISNKMT
jgi:hypothetical protein